MRARSSIAAANAVGNAITFNGISLSIGDQSSRSLTAKARGDAVKQAITQARQLAAVAGVKLGAVRNIDDTGSELPPPQFFGANDLATTNAAAPVPIQAGSQQLSVYVAVTFAVSSCAASANVRPVSMPHAVGAIRLTRASSICAGPLPGITRPYRAIRAT